MRSISRAAVVCALLLGAATPTFAADDKSAFSKAQKEELGKLVREYILENPGIIREAVSALQAKEEKETAAKQTAMVKKNKDKIFSAADDTVLGNPKGDVTLVEFFDYNCGYCKQMFPAMMEAIKQDGKVRLIMKEFPILGPVSVTASQAALAARKQGKYAPFHTAMITRKGSLTEAAVFQVAKDVGLDVKKLQDDMKSPEIEAIIARNHSLAEELGIDGTPAVLVNETLIAGSLEQERVADLIKTARK